MVVIRLMSLKMLYTYIFNNQKHTFLHHGLEQVGSDELIETRNGLVKGMTYPIEENFIDAFIFDDVALQLSILIGGALLYFIFFYKSAVPKSNPTMLSSPSTDSPIGTDGGDPWWKRLLKVLAFLGISISLICLLIWAYKNFGAAGTSSSNNPPAPPVPPAGQNDFGKTGFLLTLVPEIVRHGKHCFITNMISERPATETF